MDLCPFSGEPCPHKKCVQITEVKDNEAVNVIHCCQGCGGGSIEPPPSESQDSPINKQALSLFEVLKALIHNKFSLIPSQIVLTNSPQAFHPKPPCPSCNTKISDIAKTHKLGCPSCYDHYSKELLPVLIHAHKACEHIGKEPKHRQLTEQETIGTLELRLRQAVEQENYERAKEIKDKLDSLKAQGQ